MSEQLDHLQKPIHSPEPWELHDASHPVGYDDGPTICAINADGSCHEIAALTGCQGMTHEHLVACGERIVACINACRGIPTELLVQHGSLAFYHHTQDKMVAGLHARAAQLAYGEQPCSPDANS